MAKVEESGLQTYFKFYDVRSELGVNFDAFIANRIGRAVAEHFGANALIEEC